MKKVWLVIAIVIVGALSAFFFLQNHEAQPTPEVGVGTEKIALSNKQVPEVDVFELSGKVIDGLTKKPLSAKIKVMHSDQVIATTNCNDAGEFTVSLKNGEYEIAVEYPHYVKKGKYDVNRLIEIDDEPVRMGDTELWPEAIVKGRVVSENQGIEAELQFIYQKDHSNAKHYLFKTIKTDQNGYFTLDGAYGGVQNIRISADNLVSQKLSDITLTPGETVDLGEIPMQSGLTIYGVVKEKNTRKGIAGASVLCINGEKIVTETKTAIDGSYTLPVIDLNKFRIVIFADGFHSSSAFLEAENQNRYEYNAEMAKLEAKKPTDNSDIQNPENVENSEAMAQQNDEQKRKPMDEKLMAYKDKIQNVVRENSDEFRNCYEELLAIEAAAGRINFQFQSSSSGDVFNIKVNNTEINNEDFLECLTEVIANFHFPQRNGDGLLSVEYTFMFENHNEPQ